MTKKELRDFISFNIERINVCKDGFSDLLYLGGLLALLTLNGVKIEPKTLTKKGWFGQVKTYQEGEKTAVLRTAREFLESFDSFELREDVLRKRVAELENGIREWADVRMKGYADTQYGIGDLKKLLMEERI